MIYRDSEGECHGEMSSLMPKIDSTVKQRVYSDDCTNPVKTLWQVLLGFGYEANDTSALSSRSQGQSGLRVKHSLTLTASVSSLCAQSTPV